MASKAASSSRVSRTSTDERSDRPRSGYLGLLEPGTHADVIRVPEHVHGMRNLGKHLLEQLNALFAQLGDITDRPVILPPGCARLATNPSPTGSELRGITMGIVRVASRAATTDGEVAATMTSTLACTSSAARAGSRSKLAVPPANFELKVLSFHVAQFAESRRETLSGAYPSLHRGRRIRKPIRAILAGCCANRRSGAASASAVSARTSPRRVFI